jgi:hypothetical protein
MAIPKPSRPEDQLHFAELEHWQLERYYIIVYMLSDAGFIVERRYCTADALEIYMAPLPRSTAPLRDGHCASEVLGATKLAEVWPLYPRRTRVEATMISTSTIFGMWLCIPLEFLYVGQPKSLRPVVGLLANAAHAFHENTQSLHFPPHCWADLTRPEPFRKPCRARYRGMCRFLDRAAEFAKSPKYL